MRKILKRVASFLLIPVTRWYLRKERKYRHGEIHLRIYPGVFHPGLFSSTGFLLKFLQHQTLADTRFLELGCGSGLISIYAAKSKAYVTASDISSLAVENTRLNAQLNKVEVRTIQSDLFDQFEHQRFDWIIINPPYYAKTPEREEDYAWYCGVNFEYFEKLFGTLAGYIHPASHVIMVLTKGCDLNRIFSIASKAGFSFTMVGEKNVFFDENDFIYKLNERDHAFAPEAVPS